MAWKLHIILQEVIMREFLMCLIALAVLIPGAAAHAGFSTDVNFYQHTVADLEGDQGSFVFYGAFDVDTTKEDAAGIKVFMTMRKSDMSIMLDAEDQPMKYDLNANNCEILQHADSGIIFRCYSDPAAMTDEDMANWISFLGMDPVYIHFEMGTAVSPVLWGRSLQFKIDDITDTDSDGAPDIFDDCKSFADLEQIDTDNDGVGDACDLCPQDVDPLQKDTDADLVGDACDPCPAIPNSTACVSEDDDVDEDADPENLEGDGSTDLGDWLATTEEEVADYNAASAGSGCSLVPNQGAGMAAYIMIALAMLPLACRRRK